MLSELHQIKTRDGLLLEGLFFKPKKRRKVAAFYVGGLSSRFSGNPKRLFALARAFLSNGIAFAAFDHRGSGTINFVRRPEGKKSIFGGVAFECFEDSVYDIEAVIQFLKSKGFRKIYLFGSSTGATKAAYYIWKKKSKGLSGFGLLGAISDIPVQEKDLGPNYARALRLAEQMVKGGKGSWLMPRKYVSGGFWGAARLLSIAKRGRREDTFPYYDAHRHFYWAKRVRIPVLVLIGSKDQFADRPVKDILDAFRREVPKRWFSGVILPGAPHSFTGREKELARVLTKWITRVEAQV